MAKRKSTFNPGQMTFFDIVEKKFDSMIEQIESIEIENQDDDNKLKEALYGIRQTNTLPRNSVNSIDPRDNTEASPITQSTLNTISKADTGQVGIEQSREAQSVRGGRLHSARGTLMEAGRYRAGSLELGDGLRFGGSGNEQMGNFRDTGSEYRAINYSISEKDNLGVGGAKTKYADNIKAIKLLQDLEVQKSAYATELEQSILVKYVGWGGIPQAFDKDNATWQNEYEELKALLPAVEYAEARRSTQDAHYTSDTIIKSIYDAMSHLGVSSTQDSLKILEPSAGIGNFIGLKPNSLQAQFFAVEQDPTTAKIGKFLYPDAKHFATGFQETRFKNPAFDVVVGNPPFGSQKIYDKNFPELSQFSIHNYFIAKSLKLLKEDGIGAFVVSRHFLDSMNSAHREEIAQYANFLGAVRLPSTAFKQNALTEVTADIVFFQKQTKPNNDMRWIHSTNHAFHFEKTNETGIENINAYFQQNPEQVLGQLVFSSGKFENELKCIETPDFNLQQALSTAIQKLPVNIFQFHSENSEKISNTKQAENDLIQSKYFQSLKEGSFCVLPGTKTIVTKNVNELNEFVCTPVTLKNEKSFLRLAGMIKIRDTLRALLNLEKADASEQEITQKRHNLNAEYNAFKKSFQCLNSQTNKSLIRMDPEASLLQSLEVNFDKGISKDLAKKTGQVARAPNATKATIFTKRVLEPVKPILHADSLQDALSITLREKGNVDFTRISSLLGRSAESIQTELQNDNLIFLNPTNAQWEIKDKYLSGNVKEKLAIAQLEAEKNPKYRDNVNALLNVLPKDIEAVDIGVTFGTTWIPAEDILSFINERIGGLAENASNIEYMPLLGRWDAKVKINDPAINYEVWGSPEYSAEKLITSLLSNRPIKVEKLSGKYDDNNKPIMVVDQELTEVAMDKANAIKQAFQDWIWTDDDRRERLTRFYNDKFNTHVTPNYDGSHFELTGASTNISLRPHQKDAIWRSIQEGTALFDHVVGAGKTLAAIGTIMESKRMGLTKKAMLVVPNHLVYQWRDETYKLYPDANILVPTKEDFLKENRERLFARIATGEWDAVIVPHSSFIKIDMPKETQKEILEEQINAVLEAIAVSKHNEGSKATVKQLEKQRDSMKAKFDKLIAGAGKKDVSVDFSDLGVDALWVDESHEFKNLAYTTTMNVSGLGNIKGSSKALDLFIKCRHLQKENNGKGVYFLTGTPISNTIAEVYTLQRYMQFDELGKKNIEHFDAWASTFGQVVNDWGLDATGVNYKLTSSFTKFKNVPELLSMYRTFADVVTKSDLEEQAKNAGLRPFTPPVLGGKPYNDVIDRSPSQALYMEDIIERMEHLPRDTRIDNPLKITNDARKAGLDYRLIDPDSPDFENTKINACVNRIYDIWQKSSEDKGTQLCFCDLSTPKKSSQAVLIQEVASIDDEFADKNDIQEEDVSPVDMDSIIANMSSSDKFSVYEDIKEKLIKKGIPQREIAFIHDANTDLQKAQLFSDVNNGNIRVLLGSTSKMGAGMNVQQRLVAAHHLDAPWRPSDLEQRNGRIIRQGNQLYEKDPENFQVGIYYYATKQTYDARMWQTIERKASAIEQFRKGDVLQRTIEDVQSEAANAAEMKAAASGNPLILMEVSLKAERGKLEALSSQYNRGKHRLSDRLKYLSGTEERYQVACVQYAENIKNRDDNTQYIKEKDKEKVKFEVFANSKIMTGENAKELQELVKKCVNEVTRNTREEPLLCRYRGFEVHVKYAQFGLIPGFSFALSSHGREYQPLNLMYKLDNSFSLSGLFQRMDNFLEKGFDEKLEKDKLTYEREKNERPNIELALDKGFEQQAELDLVRVNHESVVRELQRMQTEPGYVSEWQPKTLENVNGQTASASEKGVIDITPAEPKTSLSTANNDEGNKQQTPVIEQKISKMKLS